AARQRIGAPFGLLQPHPQRGAFHAAAGTYRRHVARERRRRGGLGEGYRHRHPRGSDPADHGAFLSSRSGPFACDGRHGARAFDRQACVATARGDARDRKSRRRGQHVHVPFPAGENRQTRRRGTRTRKGGHIIPESQGPRLAGEQAAMEVEDLGHHISRRFNEDLERVRNSVLTMGGLVEEQLARGMRALAEGDSEHGLRVAEDDAKVNRMEVSIDEECSRILATRAPTAGDLRLIIAVIKTITDLERIGDEAEKIGVLAARLATVERPSTNYRELRNLATHVQDMLRGALDAFARLDADAALAVVKADDVVDEEYEAITRQGITFMIEDPRTISRVMDTMWVARALE